VKKRYKKFFNGEYNFHITEAVIYPEDYLEIIQKNLDNLFKTIKKFKNLKSLCLRLSIFFRKNKIEFYAENSIVKGMEQYIKIGINNGKTLHDRFCTIGIFCNENLLKVFNSEENADIKIQFMKWFIFVLKHELVHRGQMLSVDDENLRHDVFQKNYKDRIAYLSDKQEIMARAWEIIELFKLRGYDIEKISTILKTKNLEKLQISTLRTYQEIFTIDSWQMKLLYKYMYMYLEEN
jgi:hypothetical protein